MSAENMLDLLIHTSVSVSPIAIFVVSNIFRMLTPVLSTFEKSSDVLSNSNGHLLTEKITEENCDKHYDRVN
jgi:hypothetical protein